MEAGDGGYWSPLHGFHCGPCSPVFPRDRFRVGLKGLEAAQPLLWFHPGWTDVCTIMETWPFLPMLQMGPRKLPLASPFLRTGGSRHCRYCEVCRFHSVGICHLANSQVSAIPVRVSCSRHGQSCDEVSSQVLAIPKVWQSWFLQGASREHCDRGPVPACRMPQEGGGGHS